MLTAKGKNAHQALDECRHRTDYYSWAVDIDIRGYFDNIPHERLMLAVKHYCPQLKWLHTYLWRILKAPVQLPDGSIQASGKGVSQGGVISPLLSNLYLNVVFDGWIGKQIGAKFAFERYADDIIIHTVSEQAAKFILNRIRERFTQCGLELHPEKTRLGELFWKVCREQHALRLCSYQPASGQMVYVEVSKVQTAGHRLAEA